MARFVQAVASLAVLAAVAVGLWQGSGWIAVAKRGLIAYLAGYGVAGILAVIVRASGVADAAAEPPQTGASGRDTADLAAMSTADAGTDRADSRQP